MHYRIIKKGRYHILVLSLLSLSLSLSLSLLRSFFSYFSLSPFLSSLISSLISSFLSAHMNILHFIFGSWFAWKNESHAEPPFWRSAWKKCCMMKHIRLEVTRFVGKPLHWGLSFWLCYLIHLCRKIFPWKKVNLPPDKIISPLKLTWVK